MKKTLLLLLTALVGLYAHAQDDRQDNNDIHTIFSKHNSNGGYGAFSIGYSQIDGKDALMTGARGAFIFNRSLAIGLGGFGFVNDFSYNDILGYDYKRTGLAGGYGGIFIEPIIGARMPIHISFPVLFGIGGVALVEEYNDWYDSCYNDDSDVYLVIEPAAEVELNIVKFMRLAGYVSYRYTSDIVMENTASDVLRGWNVGLTFKIGKF